MSKAYTEALKEMGRYVVLGILSWLLTGGVEILLGFFQASLSLEVMSLLVAVLTIGLRGIDKYLHENAATGVAGGITRF